MTNLRLPTPKKSPSSNRPMTRYLSDRIEDRQKAQSPKAEDYFPISEELGIQSRNHYSRLLALREPLEQADPSWAHWVRAARDVAGRDVPLLIRGNHRRPGPNSSRGDS